MSYAPLEIKKLAIRLFKSGAHTQAEISKIVGYSAPAIKIWIAGDKRGEPLSAPRASVYRASWTITIDKLYVNSFRANPTLRLKASAKL